MPRLVIVSNRVPLPVAGAPKAGGLAVALKDVVKPGALWFGWSGEIVDQTPAEARTLTAGGVTYATLGLSQADYDAFYVGFSNESLWPLLHFRPGLVEFERENYLGYLRVNEAFARALKPLLQPGDLIWIHDFHLIPLGAALRRLGVTARLGFFLHVPFVPPRVMDVLPTAKDIIADLCAFDLIGFQTKNDARDFIDCARTLSGATATPEGVATARGEARVIVNPIGIDAAAFAALARRSAAGAEVARLRASLQGRSLIVGVDRLDYSKGLANRFEAFARLLAARPEHRGAVSMLQIAARSREDVGEYQRLKRDLDRKAGEINGRFGQIDWVPIRYMTRSVARPTIAGLCRIARIGLVTPLRDGMNLVAKEFVAAQVPEDPGVLVLSRFAGAAEDMTDALLVNPTDADEIADALHQALVMPLEERRDRHAKLMAAVERSSAEVYATRFVAALAAPRAGEALSA